MSSAQNPPAPTRPGLADTEWVLIELKSDELNIAFIWTHFLGNSVNVHRPLTPEGVTLQTPGPVRVSQLGHLSRPLHSPSAAAAPRCSLAAWTGVWGI